MNQRFANLIAVTCLLLCSPPSMAQNADPLSQLNKTFRDAHGKARTIVLERSGPIIVVDLETLVLLHKKTRTEIEVVPSLYHRLKAVSHGPLAVYLTVARAGTGAWPPEQLTEVQQLRETILAADKTVSEKTFPAEKVERQHKILEACGKFLDKVTAAKTCSTEDLIAFARQTRPLVMANANEAAKLQIDAYDAKVAEWRAKLSPEEWSKLRVVITGSALPRRGNLATQFFAKVLGTQGEGKRILYAEALFDETKALRLLAASEVDADMGHAFFDDPTRLHRDLLDEAATLYLKERGGQLKSIAPAQK